MKGRKQGLKSMIWNRRKKETFNQTDRKETSSLAGEGDPQQDGKVADHAGRAG